MTLYKIHIDDRNFGSWSVFNATTLQPIVLDGFDPIQHKLFTNDIFTYNKGKLEIIHSSIRVNENIPAVLLIADNKTYGREPKMIHGKTDSLKTHGRLLYKCIPDDKRIPIFLVPYEIKQMGFSKVFTNLYVTIRCKEWDDKHPHANLSQIIGPVDVLDNFYEYQLYCKSLNTSIQKFNKATSKVIKEKAEAHDSFITSVCKKYPQIEDRTSWKTFTIDPATSLDYDDGFSIRKLDNNQTLLSIYIANVTIWMDSLNLWSSFSQRISTIYLPDRKRPMLPTILSDCLCSLQQNTRRFAFVIDILLDNDANILSIKYSNCLIKVFKNFAYEDYSLLSDTDYNYLLETCQKMSKKYKYINNVRNSHEVVCYLMIFMNHHCAQELLKFNNGIFRSTIMKKQISLPNSLPTSLPDDVNQFIKIWNSASGQYIDLSSVMSEDREQLTRHETLEMDAYIHITSPIRRLVDLLNMIKFQQNFGLITLSTDAIDFYNNWIQQIEYINITMRSIRKIQTDCNLLDLCYNNPSILEKTYDGYCFDKLIRNDGLYQFIVFLPELHLSSRITIRDNLENYEKRQYKLFLFSNEEKFKKKIRLQIV
jgi:exoribonuclease R